MDAADLLHSLTLETVAVCWGGGARLTDGEVLSNRLSAVMRFRLEGVADGPETLIIKQAKAEHMGPGGTAVSNQFFAAECVALQFLSQCGLEEGMKPMLYAADIRGTLIMEDLGRRNYDSLPRYDELIDLLMRALVRLHARAGRHLSRYEELWGQAGFGPHVKDRRDCCMPRQISEARNAMGRFLKDCPKHATTEQVEAELRDVIDMVSKPGIFLTLIHDDICHGRQTFRRGNEILLLDFEHSHPGHALMDLARLLLGKMELRTAAIPIQQIWVQAEFPLAAVDAYRRLMAEEEGQTFRDEDWRRHLAACLVFGAFQILGYGEQALSGSVGILGSMRQNFNGVLYRLAALLNGWSPYPGLQEAILRYLCIPNLAWVAQAQHNRALHRHHRRATNVDGSK